MSQRNQICDKMRFLVCSISSLFVKVYDNIFEVEIMGLHLREKVWHYSFMCNGKRVRGSTGKTSEKDAKKFESDKIKELKGELVVAKLAEKVQAICFGKSIPLKDGFDEFLKIPRRFNTGEKRLHTNRAKFDDFVAFMSAMYPGIEQINMVTTQHAQEYIQYLRRHGRYNKTLIYKRGKKTISHTNKLKKLAVATVNDCLALLKMVFNTLMLLDCAEMHKNPFDKIENQKRDTIPREAFSPEELKLIGEKSKGTYLYPLFLIGISTGLREGDICTLRWREVNLKTGWIVDRILLKTGKKVSIPLLPGLHRYLLSLPQDGEYCVPELAAIYLNDSAKIGRDVTAFLESIGIVSTIIAPGRDRASSVRDVQSLRHTFAYLAAINNMPLPVVQSVLGHFSPEMTKKYMDHCTSGAKAEYMKKLPDYISGDVIDVQPKDLATQLKSMTADNWKMIRDELLQQVS